MGRNMQHVNTIEYVSILSREKYDQKNQAFYLDQTNSLWIYNTRLLRYQLISSLELIRSMHVPAKLSLVKPSKYIDIDNVNRTPNDGLDACLLDKNQQHHLMDTTKLDEAIDDLKKKPVHVPSKLDMKQTSEYISVENVNREDLDVPDDKQQHHLIDATKLDETIKDLEKMPFHLPGKIDMKNNSQYISVSNVNREDLTDKDENQQHFLIDTTRLEEKLTELPDSKYQHVPSKLDIINDKNKLLTAVNENRTAADGLPAGLEDKTQQHHVIDAKGLNDLVNLITPYNHVPAILAKFDNEYDFLTVDNKNRAKDDGLPDGLEDYLFQKHVLNTSKLDLIIDNLQVNNGIETVLFEGPKVPEDGSNIEIGDTTKFNDVKVYYRSASMSVNQSVNFITPIPNQKTSFVLMNIGDNPNTNSLLTGELGQTLAQFNDDLSKTTIGFSNTNVYRFRNDVGTGGNGAFNTIDTAIKMQPGGSISFGNAHPPHTSLPGNGWIEIIKITGVVYGSLSTEKTLDILISRLNKNQYTAYQDFNPYVKYVISSQNEKQLELLDHLEKFETELRSEPITAKEADNKTRYDYLIEYREKLRKGLAKNKI